MAAIVVIVVVVVLYQFVLALSTWVYRNAVMRLAERLGVTLKADLKFPQDVGLRETAHKSTQFCEPSGSRLPSLDRPVQSRT